MKIIQIDVINKFYKNKKRFASNILTFEATHKVSFLNRD